VINLIVAAILTTLVSGASGSEKLKGFNALKKDVSVSGLSSGAFMTAQLHVAYSGVFDKGAGIIAGGPYFCVGSYENDPSKYLFQAMTTCMMPATPASAPDGKGLFEKAKVLAKEKKIDPLTNLKDDRVYIFSGSSDKTVKTIVVDQVLAFYIAAGIPGNQILYEKNTNAGHAIIVDDADTPCSETAPPYINNCGFEQSGKILEQIYGNLKPPSKRGVLSGGIIKFDQGEFIPSQRTSMDKDAYVYVPKACEEGGCRVHVVIHGCQQGAKVIGDKYYAYTGYNEVADTNRIIVLYPQVAPSEKEPCNTEGCWDFWGYSSDNPDKPVFFMKDSPQMKAIVGMVKRLQSK
jgi:hypothetical protein